MAHEAQLWNDFATSLREFGRCWAATIPTKAKTEKTCEEKGKPTEVMAKEKSGKREVSAVWQEC